MAADDGDGDEGGGRATATAMKRAMVTAMRVADNEEGNGDVLGYEKLWYLFYRYLLVPHGTTQKSTARKCNISLSIEIHGFRDPSGVVKYGHVC
jgi:hypothetical protein